jgi:hypothetical protein
VLFQFSLHAQTCGHQTRFTPFGMVVMFRNGAMLKIADYTMANVPGSSRPSFTPNAFADQDAIAIMYTRAMNLPGTTTPWGYSLVREEWNCTGNLNPPPPPIAITRFQCVGSGPTWNCAGIELWSVTVNGTTQVYSVTPASSDAKTLPPCANPPVPGVSCYQPAAIGDPPLASVVSGAGPIGDFAVLRDPTFPMCFAVPRDFHDLCGNLAFGQ